MADSWHSTIFTVSGGHFLNNSNGTVGATRFLHDNSHTVEDWRFSHSQPRKEIRLLRSTLSHDQLDETGPSCCKWKNRFVASVTPLSFVPRAMHRTNGRDDDDDGGRMMMTTVGCYDDDYV